MATRARSLLRDRGHHDGGRVGMVELFFDLVFVFAVTQISHTLLAHLDGTGALQALMLLLAVWWGWIDTTWVTNWLDPERIPVRLCLFAMMLAGLMLSSSIPQAFHAHGLAFAVAFAAFQIGRTLFFLWAVRHEETPRILNFVRILVWLSLAGACWVLGGLAHGHARMGWWGAALAIETAGPLCYFRVPGLGASQLADWDVDGEHLAERCSLFLIIALGESLLITGATFAELTWTPDVIAAMVTAFIGTVAMWWIYFDTGAERASARMTQSDTPGHYARVAYTYLHIPIVAGVIVSAVADELVLAHPDHASDAGLLAILGGPALYLLGTASFKWVTNARKLPPLSHLAGLLLLAAIAPFAFAHAFSALALAMACVGVLVVVALWESLALRCLPRTPDLVDTRAG